MGPKKKGFTDVVFMLSFAVFIVFFIWITSQLAPYGVPQMNALDLGILGGSIIGVGVSCAIITGIPCAVATIVSSIINIFIIPPVYLIVFIPMLFVLSYIMAKMARGN
jgi:hypothetical protein